MASSIGMVTSLNFLKKSYISKSENPKFCNRLLLHVIPHIELIDARDRKYFEDFITSQLAVDEAKMIEIRAFIDSISDDESNILWTYADNFKYLAEEFRKTRTSTWLYKKCVKHIIRITEQCDGTVKCQETNFVGEGGIERRGKSYWIGDEELDLTDADIRNFSKEIGDFIC